ncbi:hypothetical protein [Spongiactinospora sp. 9N601]|uniref:hypothetical protein n=1 Tax=Spongiactinospora sp. 9N601 TaxID=3375149 RepID=UPI0037877B95
MQVIEVKIKLELEVQIKVEIEIGQQRLARLPRHHRFTPPLRHRDCGPRTGRDEGHVVRWCRYGGA